MELLDSCLEKSLCLNHDSLVRDAKVNVTLQHTQSPRRLTASGMSGGLSSAYVIALLGSVALSQP